MNSSPLQFARQFEKLKGDIASEPASDNRLLLLLEFWDKLAPEGQPAAADSYVDEFRSLLEPLITRENLHDLRIDELKKLLEISSALALNPQQETIALQLASLHCWVGEIGDAVAVLRAVTGEETPASETFDKYDTGSAIDLVAAASEKLTETSPRTAAQLRAIHSDWLENDNTLSHERVNCLFVEKDASGRSLRGRMRVLKAQVEFFGRKAVSNEVTFETQIKAPDDPFVGSLYNSLTAARSALDRFGLQAAKDSFLHSHFNIEGKGRTFTGDSIGLAAALVSYCQLLHPQVLWHERFLSADTVVTGSVGEDGKIGDVNNETLKLKIERAFFSPVKYLVLPESNISRAREFLATLTRRYPRRSLKLVFAAHLSEAIDDHNVIRSEKVCVGEFVVRKAASYTRTTKIQVPLLLALVYLLVSILFPKAWVFLDRNPEYVRVTPNGFDALNADSVAIWSRAFDCEYAQQSSMIYEVGDIDGDGKNDIAYSVCADVGKECEQNTLMYVVDHKGRERFTVDCLIRDVYSGDTLPPSAYNSPQIAFARRGDTTIIVTSLNASNPSRAHIRVWSNTGKMQGEYVNWGTLTLVTDNNLIDGYAEGLLLFGYNNRLRASALFLLPVSGAYGASPPYYDDDYDVESAPRGNQISYMIFPQSDVSLALNQAYNFPKHLRFRTTRMSEAIINVDPTIPEQIYPAIHYFVTVDEFLRVSRVDLNSQFMEYRDGLVSAGLLDSVNKRDYCRNLEESIMYYTDSLWVTEADLRAAEK